MWLYPTKASPQNFTFDELEKLSGDLEFEEAQIAVAKYLYANPYLAVQLLTGVKLQEYQELAIRTLCVKDTSMFVWGRGVSKTFLSAIFICFYSIFNPGVKIVVAASNYRQTQQVFKSIETLANDSRKGSKLSECIESMSKSPSAWAVNFTNKSETKFLPLGQGDQIRGQRAHVLIVDEFLLMNENIFSKVIQPFLVAKQHGLREHEIHRAEDILIEEGLMKPDERSSFSSNKLIVLSSASYKFQYLYQLYERYIERIREFMMKSQPSDTAIIKMSYRAVPEKSHLDSKVIKQAKQQISARMFRQEYEAEFIAEGGGFFDVAKMDACTIPPGQHPTVLLKGKPGKKYILALDPNYNDSEVSDAFAMSVFEIDEAKQSGTLVHPYALPRSDIRKRADYIKYLIESFNIVFIIADNAGGKKLFDDLNTLQLLDRPLGVCDLDFENDNKIRETLNEYNVDYNKIVYLQKFQMNLWTRTANEHLSFCIENKKIIFAAPIFTDADEKAAMNQKIPIDKLFYDGDCSEPKNDLARETKKRDLIDHLGALVEQTKKECALIETKSTPSGHVQFAIPSNLRGDDNDPGRVRRDLYTVAVLGMWGLHLYFEMERVRNNTPKKKSFRPVWVA